MFCQCHRNNNEICDLFALIIALNKTLKMIINNDIINVLKIDKKKMQLIAASVIVMNSRLFLSYLYKVVRIDRLRLGR